MRQNLVSFVLVIAVSVYGALLMSDVFLWWQDSGVRQTGDLYVRDAERGYAMRPGFKGVVTTTQPFAVMTNAAGYRDREWSADAPVRVLVAGDSFVFGEPLPIEDGIVRKTEACLGPDARAYNAGISGYGVPQVLATIRKECPALRPQHVYYLYYLNDTSWDEMDPSSRTVVDGFVVQAVAADRRTPLSDAELEQRVKAALAARRLGLGPTLALAHLGRFLDQRGIHPRRLWGGAMVPATPATETGNADDYTEEASRAAAGMVTAMREAAAACGGDFSMVVLPSLHEVTTGLEEPATRRLIGQLAGSGIDIVDLRQTIPRDRRLHLARDRHFNAEGTAWVAAGLAEHFAHRHGSLPASPPRCAAQ